METSWDDARRQSGGKPAELTGFPFTALPGRQRRSPGQALAAEETAKLLGGNCRPVFQASLG